MASYDSGYYLGVNLTREQLVEKLAELKTIELDYNESGFDFTVTTVVNGVTVCFLDQPSDGHSNFPNDDDFYFSDEYKAADKEMDSIDADVHKLELKIVMSREEAKKAEETKQNERNLEIKRQSELKLLKSLQERYPTN